MFHPPHDPPLWAWLLFGAIELTIRIIALGVVPKHRRASTSTAWLLLIFAWPLIGVPLYLMFGSWWAMGRSLDENPKVDAMMKKIAGEEQENFHFETLSRPMRLAHTTAGFSQSTGSIEGLYNDTPDTFKAMARAVDNARHHVHLLYYQSSWDEATAPLYEALTRAVQRGVQVRLLVDHHGMRTIPGHRSFIRRLNESGIQWYPMLPFAPLRGQIRRPDLRNHRKLLIVDTRRAFVGSHNLVAADYDTPAYQRAGITFDDTSVCVRGAVVRQLEAVFAADWYFACKEELNTHALGIPQEDLETEALDEAPMMVVPSGPAYRSEPNLRLFVDMVSCAKKKLSIASPYFIPDEALLTSLTNAALRGVDVELFVSEQFDQFLVGHAQRSYYGVLMRAGVRIHLYAPPTMSHSKYIMVDDSQVAIGSSNMDFRSFGLNYEIMLLADDAHLSELIEENNARARSHSRELTFEEWKGYPWYVHYVDNVCRLGSALL